jgi:hypothetical protein
MAAVTAPATRSASRSNASSAGPIVRRWGRVDLVRRETGTPLKSRFARDRPFPDASGGGASRRAGERWSDVSPCSRARLHASHSPPTGALLPQVQVRCRTAEVEAACVLMT